LQESQKKIDKAERQNKNQCNEHVRQQQTQLFLFEDQQCRPQKRVRVKGMSWVLSNEIASWPGKSNDPRYLMSETKQAE